jgi:hypothetical protein
MSNEANVTVNPRTYCLTMMATAGGTTNPSPGTYTYTEGTSVPVTANPNANYQFVHWELDGVYNGTASSTTVFMNANHTMKAVFAQIMYTLTVSAGTGGTTNPAPGTYSYASGSSVNVTALPSVDYLFDHWVLDGSPYGSANPASVLMNGNHTLQAVFAIINYTLTITTTAGGTTNPAPGAYVYSSGSSVPVTASPNANYKFIRWQLDGSNVTTDPITVLMNSSHTLNAVFSLLTYRLTVVGSAGGSTNPAPGVWVYTNGTSAAVTATADTYYLLDHWLLDGNSVGSANPYTVLMMDDHTLQPVFAQVNFTLTISATTGGTTNPAPGSYSYPGGTSLFVTATNNSGYKFDHWVFDSVPSGSANPISILMNNSRTLQAVFVETHTLTIIACTGGTIIPVPGIYVYDNPTNATVQAIAGNNYFFDHWIYDGVNMGSQNPITVYVGSSHTLYAIFSLINHTLTVEASVGGTTNPVAGSYVHTNGSVVGVTATAGANYFFDHWILDGLNVGSVNPTSVMMTSDHTLRPVFSLINYTLTITTTAGGTTNPTPGTYTYGSGSSVPVTANPNVNYVLDYWELDSVNVGSANPYSVSMNQNHTLKAFFKSSLVNYVLTITASAGGTTSPVPGTYTYASGSNVQVTANPSVGFVLDYWELDGSNVGIGNPYSVMMNQNHTLKAWFKSAPPAPPTVSIDPPSASAYVGQSVLFTSTVTGGVQPYTYQWYLDNDPVSGATSPTWIFSSGTVGTYYVYLKVTDVNDNTVQSSTSPVTFAAPPTGGYSTSLAKQTQAPTLQLTVYVSLVAVFGAALVLKKRKRK